MRFSDWSLQDLVNYMIKAQSSSSVISHTTSSSLLRDLYDATLAQFISEAAGRSSQEVVSSAVSAADAPLNSYLTGDSSVAEHLSQCKNIFLSGVTGFLGCHLLQDLIEKSSANVHCLVRASSGSQTDAKHRLDSCLRKYKVELTLEQLARVHVHNGDLSLPLFGLPEDQFMQLSQLLDVVVHNGAHVNWLMTYAQLRPANVLVCVFYAENPRRFVFCSFFLSAGNCNGIAIGSNRQAQMLRSHINAQVQFS
jgi:hypothetical protein